MMKNDSVYFKNIFHIGDMYLDHVFFEFEYEPIIFTCTDSNNSLYLCICSEIRYVQRWIITKTDINILRQLVYKKIDIASAFLMSSELYIVERNLEGKENCRLVNHDNIDRLNLPKENIFLKCNLSDAENYLNKISFCFRKKSLYKVTAITFFKCPALKTMTLKAMKLTKKTAGKKAFKGVSKKLVIKVPKKMKKGYVKIFKGCKVK